MNSNRMHRICTHLANAADLVGLEAVRTSDPKMLEAFEHIEAAVRALDEASPCK